MIEVHDVRRKCTATVRARQGLHLVHLFPVLGVLIAVVPQVLAFIFLVVLCIRCLLAFTAPRLKAVGLAGVLGESFQMLNFPTFRALLTRMHILKDIVGW